MTVAQHGWWLVGHPEGLIVGCSYMTVSLPESVLRLDRISAIHSPRCSCMLLSIRERLTRSIQRSLYWVAKCIFMANRRIRVASFVFRLCRCDAAGQRSSPMGVIPELVLFVEQLKHRTLDRLLTHEKLCSHRVHRPLQPGHNVSESFFLVFAGTDSVSICISAPVDSRRQSSTTVLDNEACVVLEGICIFFTPVNSWFVLKGCAFFPVGSYVSLKTFSNMIWFSNGCLKLQRRQLLGTCIILFLLVCKTHHNRGTGLNPTRVCYRELNLAHELIAFWRGLHLGSIVLHARTFFRVWLAQLIGDLNPKFIIQIFSYCNHAISALDAVLSQMLAPLECCTLQN